MTLDVDQSGELLHHNLVLAFRFVEPRRKLAAAPLGSLDYGWLNAFLSTVFFSAALMAALILHPADTRGLEEEVFSSHNTFHHLVVNPEKKPANTFLQKLQNTRHVSGSKPRKFPKDKQGKAPTREDRRKADSKAVARSMDSLFAGPSSSSVFGAARSDALRDALGDVRGKEVGDASGFGSLVQRGNGPGSGGNSTGMYEAGRIVTRGVAGGDRFYAPGTGGIGGKTEHRIEGTGDPVIEGLLDKDLIRRVIRENVAQIKYCYERELTGTPGLHGKVLLKFVIGADGSVTTAVIEESSLKSKAAEGCMARKVKSWVFPKPKGDGVVIVTYPFIFKQGG